MLVFHGKIKKYIGGEGMKISKTAFKEFTRCPRVQALEDIYRKKMNSSTIIFNDDNYEKKLEILGGMFDEDSGEDLLEETNPQLEAMMEYYKNVEKYAIEIANRTFGIDMIYYENNYEQMRFSFMDQASHELYCYLDGYYEEEDTIYVIEVKATTSKKFIDMGSKGEKGIALFKRYGNVLLLNEEELNQDLENKSYIKLLNRYDDCGKYVYDLAIERYIIENGIFASHPNLKHKKVKYYLAVLNSDYEFDGSYLNGTAQYNPDKNEFELITFIDLTYVTFSLQEEISSVHHEMMKVILGHELADLKVGKYCEYNKQTKCLFVPLCFEKAKQKGSILEYMGQKKFKTKEGISLHAFDFINQGKDRLDSVPRSFLVNQNHRIQRDCFDLKEEYFDYEKVKKGIAEIKYPIYHLDFESFPSPLPRYAQEHPYNQSVFQFSIHVEKSKMNCDKNLDHYSYIADDFSDCRERLINELIRVIDLSEGGTVLVYNKSFEYSRIKEFATMFPRYKNELEMINKHMFDLIDIIKTNESFYRSLGFTKERSKEVNFYDNQLLGSYSIKKVLPIFSDLSYGKLDVRNGVEAIATYAMFPKLSKEDLDISKRQLHEYCKQDTWSMVVILWGLIQKLE